MQALGLSHLDDGSDEVQGPDEGVEEALFPDAPLDEVQVLVHHDLQEAVSFRFDSSSNVFLLALTMN